MNNFNSDQAAELCALETAKRFEYHWPESLKEETITILGQLFKLLADNNTLAPGQAAAAMKILAVNPHRRLSILGKRQVALNDLFETVKHLDSRLEHMKESCNKELAELDRLVKLNPLWTLEEKEF